MKKHPEAVAWDQYADANLSEFDSSNLGSPSKNNQYLRNRIRSAFMAGIEFQKSRYKKRKETKP